MELAGILLMTIGLYSINYYILLDKNKELWGGIAGILLAGTLAVVELGILISYVQCCILLGFLETNGIILVAFTAGVLTTLLSNKLHKL